jgi:hypothetical protein
MQIHRRFLYAGLFLLGIGGVLVTADLGAVDTATLTDLLRLWPLAVVAIGLALALRRTRYSLPTGILAAAVPGLVLGGVFAAGPRYVGDCGVRGEPASVVTEEGTFDGAARVSVTTGCGSLTVNTMSGSGWRLDAGNTHGRTPTVDATARSLSIDSAGGRSLRFLDDRRDTWNLTLPTSDIDRFALVAHAGRSLVDLPGARIGELALTANASEIVVDATSASVAELSGVVNVGLLSIHLPAESDLVGSVRLGGGELHLCSPPGVGLRLTFKGQPRQVTVDGLHHSGSDWESAGYDSAAHHAELHVNANFGAVKINPIGGCR